MKKLIFSSFLIASVLLFCAFRPHISETIQAKSLAVLLRTAANSWANMVSQTDLSYEAIDSWLPELGVRGRYAVVKKLMGKQVIEGIVGEKAFLGGPHMDEMDFAHDNFGQSFSHAYAGRYNPVFLTGLHKILKETLTDEAFVFDFQGFYNRELKRYLQTFYMAYGVEKLNDQSLKDDYNNKARTGIFNEYETYPCRAFWGRRYEDGTEDEFFALLVTMLETFDPSFLAAQASIRDRIEAQAAKIASQSAQSKDRISEIRAIYKDYHETIIQQKPLFEESEESEENGYSVHNLTIYADGVDPAHAKIMIREEFSSDGFLDMNEYYIQHGKIAFQFTKGVRPESHVSPNFTAFESRTYFENGRVIKILNKSMHGKFGEDEPNLDPIPNTEQTLSNADYNQESDMSEYMDLIRSLNTVSED